MPIFPNRITTKEVNTINDYYAPQYEPTLRYSPREDPKNWYVDGRGETFYGDSFDILLKQTADPDRFSSVSLSEQYLAATADKDGMLVGIQGANISRFLNANTTDGQINNFVRTMQRLAPDLPESIIRGQAEEIWSEENRSKETSTLAAYRVLPGTVAASGRAGEDAPHIVADNRRSFLSFARAAAFVEHQKAGGTKETFKGREAYTLPILDQLVKLGRIDPTQAEQAKENPELLSSIIQRTEEDYLPEVESLERFDQTAFPEIAVEADNRGLEGFNRTIFMYNEAQKRVIKQLTTVLNNQNKELSSPLVLESMAQIKALSDVVGPDFVTEALARVQQLSPWQDNAWNNLPETTRGTLASRGYTAETFLRDTDGEINANIMNEYTYGLAANLLAQEIAATNTREKKFENDWHEGWFDSTRRFTDTIKTDVFNDPFAMYFIAGTVPAGIGAGLMFSSGAAGAATNIGRVMAMTAADGLTAGAAEGYAVSQAGQAQAMVSGEATRLDWGATFDTMMMYGGFGAVGGALLSGGIHGAPRGLVRMNTYVTSIADDIAASGVMGETAMSRALLRIAEREATVAEIEGAQLFSNIESTGLAIRLNRGEVEAKDALNEVIPSLVVVREGEEHSTLIDDLFSSENLANNGVSAAEVVDLVYGIQRALGPGGQIGTEQFDKIVRQFFRATREHRALGDDFIGPLSRGVTREATTARIDLIDATLKANGLKAAARFVGGSGLDSLTDSQTKTLKVLVQKLKDMREGGRALTKGEFDRLIDYTLRLNDEELLQQTRRLINESVQETPENTAKLKEFNTKVNQIVESGRAAREDTFLQSALKVENALGLLKNEKAVRIARELGVSPQRVMQYIRKYKGIVGNSARIAELDTRMPGVKDAIERLSKDGSEFLETYEAVPSAFNVNRFLEESDVVRNVEELKTLRRKLKRASTKAAKAAVKKGDEAVASRLEKVAARASQRYRELQAKLGINMAEEDAYARVLERIQKDIPFSARTQTEQTLILSKAIDRLILRSSPDAINVGEAGRTRAWFASKFGETSIGMRLERSLNGISTWPITQQRLFRSRNRIIRGVSNWITGQHVTNRVFSNSTDFMSVESIVEGAARESLGYIHWSKSIAARLGTESYREFDHTFLFLRQLGLLKGKPSEFDLSKVPASLLKAYEDLGGEEALRMDLYQAQRMYTSFMNNALEESAEAGFPIEGLDPARYIPNVIRGGLSAERATQFVDGFLQLRRKQLLEGDAGLDLETLHSIGWIRLTEGSEKDAMGRSLANKKFIVPEDSPFYISDDMDLNRAFADRVIKGGFAGLKALDSETPSAGTRPAVRASAAGGTAVRATDDLITDPYVIDEIAYRVQQIAGNHEGMPVGLSSELASDVDAIARIVSGQDEIINRLERDLTTLESTTAEAREIYDNIYGEYAFDNLTRDIEEALARRRQKAVQHIQSQLNDVTSSVRRRKMSLKRKIAVVNNRDKYGALSVGHKALLHRLDNLIAEGYLDEDGAKIVMLAFADLDPSIVVGLSMARQDVLTTYLGTASLIEPGVGTIRLQKIADQAGVTASDSSLQAASTLIHEMTHIAIMSANPRLQATFQALFQRASASADNEIVRFLEEALGTFRAEYALKNIHEFAAGLSEAILIGNQVENISGPLEIVLMQIRSFLKHLFGSLFIKEAADTAEYAVLGATKYQALRSVMEAIYNTIPDDTASQKLIRAFNLNVDETQRIVWDSSASEPALTKFNFERSDAAVDLIRYYFGTSIDMDEFMRSMRASFPASSEAEIQSFVASNIVGRNIDDVVFIEDLNSAIKKEMDSLAEEVSEGFLPEDAIETVLSALRMRVEALGESPDSFKSLNKSYIDRYLIMKDITKRYGVSDLDELDDEAFDAAMAEMQKRANKLQKSPAKANDSPIVKQYKQKIALYEQMLEDETLDDSYRKALEAELKEAKDDLKTAQKKTKTKLKKTNVKVPKIETPTEEAPALPKPTPEPEPTVRSTNQDRRLTVLKDELDSLEARVKTASAEDKAELMMRRDQAAEELTNYLNDVYGKTLTQDQLVFNALQKEMEAFNAKEGDNLTRSQEDTIFGMIQLLDLWSKKYENMTPEQIAKDLFKKGIDAESRNKRTRVDVDIAGPTQRGAKARARTVKSETKTGAATTEIVAEATESPEERAARLARGEEDLRSGISIAEQADDKTIKQAAERSQQTLDLKDAFESRGLIQGPKGNYQFLDADGKPLKGEDLDDFLAPIAEATGLSLNQIKKHNHAGGVLNAEAVAENSRRVLEYVDDQNTAANAGNREALERIEAVNTARVLQDQVATKAIQREVEEAVIASPEVQKTIADTSVGKKVEATTPEEVRASMVDEEPEVMAEEVAPAPAPRVEPEAEELTDEGLKERWDAEVKPQIEMRGVPNVPDEPGTRVGPVRTKDGDVYDFARPSDKDLRARYQEEALARLEAEGGEADEAAFLAARGPEPKTIQELTDDELLSLGSRLEAKIAAGERLTPGEQRMFNELMGELNNRGGGKPPKPPKTARGAGDMPEPRRRGIIDFTTEMEKYFERRTGKGLKVGEFNTEHRLADRGSLADIYRDAVNGDTDLMTEAFKKSLTERGLGITSALERVGLNYLEHAGGKFKTGFDTGMQSLDEKIGVLGSINNLHTRLFSDADIDTEGGEQIARLFADAGSSVEGIHRYAETALSSIRVQKGLNELIGEKGATINDLFNATQSALEQNLIRDDVGRIGRTLSQRETDEVRQYMQQLKMLYLRARGFNPKLDQSFSQASRIAQNMAYSILGAKFAMSVLFVETPMAVLRTSGLNPLKIIGNTGIILGSYLNAARGAASKYAPLNKFMAAFGVDNRIIRESVEDMVYSIDNLRSTSLSRFGASNDAMEDTSLLLTLADRIRFHLDTIRASGSQNDLDPGMWKTLLNGIEAVTGATSDLTGMMSFMHPVTNAVREVAANQGKATFLKHSPKLVTLAKRIASEGEVTTEQIVGFARELGIPKHLAVYAAESGLLRRNGEIIERIINLTKLTPDSPGRQLDLNVLQEMIHTERSALKEQTIGFGFEDAATRTMELDAEILPSLNQFIMYFTQELSPELRGTMRFQGMNPLTDLLFQMLSYPMAAYQALVGNGVTARGPIMTAGILSVLVGLEYFNRNAQRVLFGKDEEDRKKALEKLTRIPTEEDVVEIIAMYGTSSPMFGAIGNYVRDLVGNPILRAAGHPDRNFPATPFRSPAVGMMQKMYGQLSKGAGNLGTAIRENDASKFGTAASNILGTAIDLSPLNALSLGGSVNAMQNITSLEDMWKAGTLASSVGRSRAMPEFSYPPMEDASYVMWNASDFSPQDQTEIKYPPLSSLPPAPMAEDIPQEQAMPSSTSEVSTSPSAGLADLLNRNK